MKKAMSALLALAMALSLSMAPAMAAPAPPPTKEADSYAGPVIDYPDKKLWFDSTVYGGFYSAYQIMAGNGDDTFDVDAFINSKQGELVMSRIRYELALLGDSQYASQTMIDYWAKLGVIETVYNSEDHDHEWLTFVPDYMMAEGNTRKYPVVFCHHGNGGSLFEAVDHGFVHICYDEGFMVVAPENENSDADYTIKNLPRYLDELEAKGYPIDRTRVYVAGMSKGGATTLATGLACSDTVAAIAPHSSSFGLLMEGYSINSYLRGESHVMNGSVTQAQLDACGGMPVWMQLGESDMNQLPMQQGMIDSLNAWLAMNDCPTRAAATGSNMIGITADRVYTRQLDGTTYTFAEFDNSDGVRTMVIVGVAGLPHWVSYSYSKLAWDFMKQYSIVDGQRIYTKASYSDVDPSDDCAAAVEAVTEAGVMNGVGSGNFAPGATVTRAQVITTLGRLAGAVPTEVTAYADVAPNSWYSGYVGWAVANGIVSTDSNRFNPNGTMTGTELDAILSAYAGLQGRDYINFPAHDNMSPAPVTRGVLAQRLVKLMNAPVDYDYADKELWFKTDLYGGFFSPYQIFMGNGDTAFDMPAFVNSKHGELMMSRIKYELAILGDHEWASQTMIDYWADRGVVEKVYNHDDPEHEWLAYIPDYITNNGSSGKSWPVVFCFHGGGGTLFEATNHGFVDLCHEQGFIVICPENENTNRQLSLKGLTDYVAVLEAEGYKIDHSRIYTSGMSMGGMASMYCAVKGADIVAAATAQGCAGKGLIFGDASEFASGSDDYLDLADFQSGTIAPMYFLVGDHEMAHQIPLTDEALEGLNTWLKASGCGEAKRADNVLGFTADKLYEMEIDGTTYTFAEFYNQAGEKAVVFVGIKDWVHWTPYSYARLSWQFMSQFTNET